MFAAAIGTIASSRTASTGNGYYRSITLDQPASDLTNFPVLISGTYDYLRAYYAGGKVANSDGYDITFYSDSALTTLLDFERVIWNADTGEIEFWVRVPTLASAAATVIYMAYGDTSITTDQQDAAGTWNATFMGVWHLPNGTTLSALDSTSNNVDGTINGATAVAGKIDGGAEFVAASSQNIELGDNCSREPNLHYTVSAWVRPDLNATAYWIIGRGASSGFPREYSLFYQSGAFRFQRHDGGATSNTVVSDAHSTGTMYHVVGTYDGSNMKLYINGVQEGGDTASTVSITGTDSLHIGADREGGSLFFYFDGGIDEVHIINDDMSAVWIATEYSNQNDPANFYAIGTEQAA